MALSRPGVVRDDLGRALTLVRPVERVVSLVPSLTEAVACTDPALLVGATDWCTHPTGLSVARVGGTKNPDISRILELDTHLVIAGKEENRRVDVEALQNSGVPVWVTDVMDVPGALRSLGRILELLRPSRACRWLVEAEQAWSDPPQVRAGRPLQVMVPIWRRPWMCVGPSTYAADVLRRLGVQPVAPPGTDRYPRFSPQDIVAAHEIDLVLLPDEPYPFSASDGPEVFSCPVAYLAGRMLTWYGPSMVEAPTEIVGSLRAALH
ncbi:hypothetical protein SAMN05421595_0590 [Austwickia chelonae]|uniref:ABC transporter substrate-binding protein n=1 Tax=Austwickia chelonae NBRC 105200 TaxID=1184607 RepID=K6V789_9MICO|nr:helical backbone metal receptor [Austwickia chelonae]GAB78073.1 hypothetical protein AUCHE_08_03170 [Austwickia chelonae NBRC 105200]SEV95770.1 hypothetical protein SAMN05421595_0590 [Austwickia chelonae]